MLALHNCPICFEEFDAEHKSYVIPCGHVFCRPCLGSISHEWGRLLNSAELEAKCPICRARFELQSARLIIGINQSEEETELWDKLKGYVKANSNPPELPSLPSNQELRKIGASENIQIAVELARRLFQAENRIVESEKLCQTPLAHYQLQDTFINNNHLRGTTQTAGCVGGEKQEAEKCGEDDHHGQGVIGATSSRLSGINSSDLGWQSRASTTSCFTTPCLPSTSCGRWVPPGRRFIAAEPSIPNVILGARPSVTTSTAGGWRAREAARIATMTAASRSSDSHSTMPQHTQQQLNRRNESEIESNNTPPQAKWRPSRGRGNRFSSSGRL